MQTSLYPYVLLQYDFLFLFCGKFQSHIGHICSSHVQLFPEYFSTSRFFCSKFSISTAIMLCFCITFSICICFMVLYQMSSKVFLVVKIYLTFFPIISRGSFFDTGCITSISRIVVGCILFFCKSLTFISMIFSVFILILNLYSHYIHICFVLSGSRSCRRAFINAFLGLLSFCCLLIVFQYGSRR